MAQTMMQQASAPEEMDVTSTVEEMSREIHRLLGEMKEDQIEIDRLQEGNNARLTNIETVLARITAE